MSKNSRSWLNDAASATGATNKRREFFYLAYGLTLRSDLEFPELRKASRPARAGVRLRRVRLGRVRPKAPCEIRLSWPREIEIVVRSGKEILYEPAPRVDPRTARLVILSHAFAALFFQRGEIVLHASAVAAAGGVAAFLGGGGAGKSTLAGALNALGYPVVTDNLLVVRPDPELRARPGPAHVKLEADSARTLGFNFERLPPIEPKSPKRYVSLVEKTPSARALVLKRLYVLDEGNRAEVSGLTRCQALREIIRHSFRLRLPGKKEMEAAYFLKCAALVRQIRVERLTRPRNLGLLPQFTRLAHESILRG